MPHIHERIDFCVETFVVFKDKVLLRVHDKLGIWLSVGGHIELDEDPPQAALREVKEEVGLEVALFDKYVPRSGSPWDLVPPRFLNRHRISPAHEHVVLVYFARASTDQLMIPPHEHAECKWFSREELDDPRYEIKRDVKHYAKIALQELATRP